jgi:hypothetical protein
MKATLLFSAIIISFSAIGQTDTTGLIAHYPFNGNANDISGNNKHGTVLGATLTTDRLNHPNAAYQFAFDGSKYIKIPAVQSGVVSISLWAYVVGNSFWNAGVQKIIYARNSCSGGGHGTFEIRLNGGYPEFQSLTGGCQLYYATDLITIPGTWHHFVLTIDGDSAKAYIDGNFRLYYYINGFLSYTNEDVFIGGEGSTIGFAGKIDDIKIFNRKLSGAEVQQLFAETPSYTGIEEYEKNNVVNIYPNPADSFIYLSSEQKHLINKTEIRTVSGEIIFQSESLPEKITIENFPKGIYFFIVQQKDKSKQILKFLKQ